MAQEKNDDNDYNSYQINLWKQKKTLKMLDESSGLHTSLISLLIPPNSQLSKISKLITTELGTADNIKSRVTRQNVIDGLKMIQARLKLITWLPKNGLAIFAGNIEEGDKSRRLMCVLEPIKPIITFSYRCDNRFHTESLKEQLVNDDSYGFIIIDGSGCLFATVQGNVQTVLYRYLVDLPKKHRKGGQSSVRFARLRLEARHNYLIKVAEIAIKCFISNETNKLNVKGIVLAGSADFKDALVNEKLLDPRIQSSIIAVVDVAYGKEQGLNQAIILAAEALQNVNLVEQKKLFAKFFDEVNNSSSKVCYGLQQTMNALENGVIETLIIWENLPIIRNLVRNKNTNEESVVFTKPGQVPALKNQSNEEQPIEVIESETLVDYLAENYSQLKIQLQLVNDSTSEGSMFCQGFGGIGALLRYQFNLESEQKAEEIDEKEDEEEDDSKYWKDQLDGFVF